MSKLVVLEYLSLDGVMEAPAWTMPYWSDEHAAYAAEQQTAAGALLLGRVTYDGFAEAWPKNPEAPGAERMNGMPKFVASRTLRNPEWTNTRVLEGDVFQAVRDLKARPGGNLLVYGSATLVRGLIGAGLVDELCLWIHPVIVGQGKRLFEAGQPPAAFRLLGARPFASGSVVLTYAPASPA